MKKLGETNDSRKIGRETFSTPKIGSFAAKIGRVGISETAIQKLQFLYPTKTLLISSVS